MAERLFDEAFLNKIDRLSMRFNSAINNVYSGGRRSKMHGSTVEFSKFREYIQGDDFRRIDWNAYGRFEKFFIKLFLDEKQLVTNVFLDVSESMNFGEPSKVLAAKKLAAAFAYVSLSAGDKVAVNGIADGKASEICAETSGKVSFYGFAEKLEQYHSGGETRLTEALRGCKSLKGNQGASVLITDLMSGEDFREALNYLLYRKQQVILVHVLSPGEKEPSFDGRVRLIDSETNTYCEVEANAKTFACYKKALNDYVESIKSYCLKTGVYYLPAVSDESIESVILEKGTETGIFY